MLMICPECGHQVSSLAKTCPNCGFPMDKLTKEISYTIYDPELMEGKTEADRKAIEVATEFYGELLVTSDGRVWNHGSQYIADMQYKAEEKESSL